MSLTVGSLFSGIGGFDLGFKRAGFALLWMVEREPFCQRVLRHQFPSIELHDDVCTVWKDTLAPVDVIVGGFPCQDVSVAGKQVGLGGERSGLFWQLHRIADELQPLMMVIENVPGLLTSQQGRDFHTVLSALADLGLRRSYRILDSKHFRVAQRRRRVFLVNGARNAAGRTREILFESESRTECLETGEETWARVAATLRGRSARCGVNEPGRGGEDDSNLVAIGVHGNQRGEVRTSPVAGSLTSSKSGKQFEGVAFALRADPCGKGALDQSAMDNLQIAEVANTLLATNDGRTDDLNQTFTPTQYGVRRLTPLECERVQGFPDGWTCLCGNGQRGSRFCTCPDTPRYKALGNAVTVTVAEWIARRILQAESQSP